MRFIKTALVSIFLITTTLASISQDKTGLTIIPLGVSGGYYTDNCSSFLLHDTQINKGILLDGGSILPGLTKAAENNILSSCYDAKAIYNYYAENIPALLVTHPHMDHIQGFITMAANDKKKVIMTNKFTSQALLQHIFNWVIWPNFTDSGEEPRLSKYKLISMEYKTMYAIPGTDFQVKMFRLSHGNNGYESAAFLIYHHTDCFLYVGDTGADRIEKCDYLHDLWAHLATEIQDGNLKGIALECSYPNAQPEELLFGHLTPNLVSEELSVLAHLVNHDNPYHALEGIPIFVYHVKSKNGELDSSQTIIAKELTQHRELNLQIIVAKQGQGYNL